MVTQLYLCVDLKTRTQASHFANGESRKGMLSMSKDGEQFEFDERVLDCYPRNIKVYRGKRINVAKTSDGRYVVNFRHLELDTKLQPRSVGQSLIQELKEAKAALGL